MDDILTARIQKGLWFLQNARSRFWSLSALAGLAVTVSIGGSVYTTFQNPANDWERLRSRPASIVAVERRQKAIWAAFFMVSALSVYPLVKFALIALEDEGDAREEERISRRRWAARFLEVPTDGELAAVELALPSGPIDLPEEDLAHLMAEAALDPDNASSILIACPRRTGKSNLLRGAINAIGGKAKISVMAAKDGETYQGLEQSPETYMYSGDPAYIPDVYGRYESIIRLLDRKTGEGKPFVLVHDEINNCIAAAGVLQKTGKSKLKYDELVAGANQSIVTRGPSKLVTTWIASHSPFVEDVKLNTAIMDSLQVVVLARGNRIAAVEKALSSPRFIQSESTRQALKEQFHGYRRSPSYNPNKVIALTNLGGDFRLCIIPKYPDNGAAPSLPVGSQVDRLVGEIMIDDEREDDPIERLERLFQITADRPPNDESEEQENTEELTDRQRRILEKFGDRDGYITPSTVQRARLFPSSITREMIAHDLKKLADAGYGVVQVTSWGIRWLPNP